MNTLTLFADRPGRGFMMLTRYLPLLSGVIFSIAVVLSPLGFGGEALELQAAVVWMLYCSVPTGLVVLLAGIALQSCPNRRREHQVVPCWTAVGLVLSTVISFFPAAATYPFLVSQGFVTAAGDGTGMLAITTPLGLPAFLGATAFVCLTSLLFLDERERKGANDD